MKGDTDPIYEVAFRFPPILIHLISSDEPPPRGREPTEANITAIRNHFSPAKVQVDSIQLDLKNLEKNSYKLATHLILDYKKYPKQRLVVDLSAGRGSIRQALSRAAEIAIDMIHSLYDPEYWIQAAIRSRNQPILHYKIGKTAIPSKKDLELLAEVDQPLTQTALARKLNWNNQSEISKGIQRLESLGLISSTGHKSRVLTAEGLRIKDLFRAIS